jgi:hypothetical protein
VTDTLDARFSLSQFINVTTFSASLIEVSPPINLCSDCPETTRNP